MTKITLENSYGIYTIQVPQDDMNIDSIYENLIIPVLCASGFDRKLVEHWVGLEKTID